MFKKIALIALFLGVTAGFVYLLYRFFFSTPAATVPPSGGGITSPTGGGLPTAGTGRPEGPSGLPGTIGLPLSPGAIAPTPLVPETAAPEETSVAAQAKGLAIGQNGALNYYDAEEGKLYRLAANGVRQVLSDKIFSGAEEVIWSPVGDKVILAFPDKSKIIYDPGTQKQVTLPNHWEDPRFSPDGSMIVAKSIGLDVSSRWLISMSSDGTGAKLIEPLGNNGARVKVSVSPDASIVAFSDTSDPVGFDTRDLLLIGQNQENFPALRVEGFDFEPNWSPNGGRLLYSTAGQISNYKPMLWMVGGTDGTVGTGRRSLNINTWADKCTFQDDATAYCAVPQTLPDGAGLQRDIADTIPDSIVKVDLTGGGSSLIAVPPQATSIRSLVVSPDGSRLWYLGADGALKELKLR